MKKKYFVALIIAIVIVIGIVAAIGFSLFGQGSSQPKLVEVNNGETTTQERISLENAISVLNSHDFNSLTGRGNYTIHYIHGEDIDPSGNAKTWILAIKTNQSQFYFEYQNQDPRVYDWNEKNISRPVQVNKLITPDRLFAQHRSLIGDILGGSGITRKEIQLENGIYTLTVTKNVPKEYLFDAYTGEIIST